jgi:hypothetical protein
MDNLGSRKGEEVRQLVRLAKGHCIIREISEDLSS